VLIVGKTYLNVELKRSEQLYNIYKKASGIFDLEDKHYYVNSKKEGKEALTTLKVEYEKYLSGCIGSEFSEDDIKLLAFYGVSDWIANCSLSFLEDE
jgi:hypothetical protein